jgi:uncharacterized membrane protein YkvA (DUF1232 family)
VPWYTKCPAMAVAGYALSPIDLIPDFIPVLGYVDDLIIVPLGIWLVLALIPDEVMTACRARANESVRVATARSQRSFSLRSGFLAGRCWVGSPQSG